MEGTTDTFLVKCPLPLDVFVFNYSVFEGQLTRTLLKFLFVLEAGLLARQLRPSKSDFDRKDARLKNRLLLDNLNQRLGH